MPGSPPARSLPRTELLRRLVAFDTTSRLSNLPMVDFLSEVLDRPGVRIYRQPDPAEDKANVVAIAGPEREDRAGLVLSGHMDVVPAGEGWRSDPLTLAESGGTYVGRGACDMKGFLALATEQMAGVDPERLTAPLALVFTYDEEVGTLGARRFAEGWAEAGRLPRRTIVGEPTSLRPVRLHKGHLRLRLVIPGRSAHSAYPHLGVNAIEHGGRAIVALSALREELQRERPAAATSFPDVPFVTLNVGQVSGGVATNVVPDRCALEIGARLLPGGQSTDLIERIRQAVARVLCAHPFELCVVAESPPMSLDRDADHFRVLAAESGVADSPGVSFATDAGWLQAAGLECVVWGPGSIEVAHQPNEFIPMAELDRAAQVLDRMVRRYCAGGDP